MNLWIANIGSAMSVNSSGKWTFPSTGIWRVSWNLSLKADGADAHLYTRLDLSTDNGSNYSSIRFGSQFHTAANQISGRFVTATLDITDTSTHKVRLQAGSATGATIQGGRMYTYVEFLRLAGT